MLTAGNKLNDIFVVYFKMYIHVLILLMWKLNILLLALQIINLINFN